MIFRKILRLAYLGLFFIQNLCKRVGVFFWGGGKYYILSISFAKFWDFLYTFVFESSKKLYLFRGKIIA